QGLHRVCLRCGGSDSCQKAIGGPLTKDEMLSFRVYDPAYPVPAAPPTGCDNARALHICCPLLHCEPDALVRDPGGSLGYCLDIVCATSARTPSRSSGFGRDHNVGRSAREMRPA